MSLFASRRSVAVTDIARVETCELQLVLEAKYGKRMTPEQRRRASLGHHGHARQDALVRHFSPWHAFRHSVVVGLWTSALLTVIALVLVSGLDGASDQWVSRIISTGARVLLLPGSWATALSFQEAASWLPHRIAQFALAQCVFYVAAVYLLETLVRGRRGAGR